MQSISSIPQANIDHSEQAGHAKPVIKLSINAITDSDGAGGRENRVKVTLVGITFTLAKTYAWANDLGDFFKAPPGVSSLLNDDTHVTDARELDIRGSRPH